MSFETRKQQQRGIDKKHDVETEARKKVGAARWFWEGKEAPEGIDSSKADKSMREIRRNPAWWEEYKKVGFHKEGRKGEEEGGKAGRNAREKAFLSMSQKMDQMEDDPTITLSENERNLYTNIQTEFNKRLALATGCEELLTTDLFKGLRDQNHPLTRVVKGLGASRALDLIKPRVTKLIGESDTTEDLEKLYRALKQMHGYYDTRTY